MNELDKKFSEKLKNYQRSVPKDAWSRLENNRSSTPSSTKNWVGLAAACLLLAAACAWIIVSRRSTISTSTPRVVASNPSHVKPNNIVQPVPKVADNSVAANPEKIQHVRTRKNRIQHDVSKKISAVETLAVTLVAPLIHADTPLVQQEKTVTNMPARSQAGFKLELTAEEVNEKYVAKNESLEATPSDQKSSGIQKLLHKAHALASDQEVFADLRQKKNELLALNLRTKTKQQSSQ